MVQTSSFSKSDWQKGYKSLKTEYSYWVDDIEGELPKALQGTLFRNGPGLLDVNGDRYGHPFDGDGMVSSITFTDGKVHFANSFVKTPEFLAEQEAGKILYRGVFGTQRSGGFLQNIFNLKLKNLANTNVIYHGQKLLALWEASRPYRLNPETLETIGIENFDGNLNPGEVFTAHPKFDPITGDMYGFGVDAGPKSTINLYKVDLQGTLTKFANQKVDGFCFLHDFVITPNYAIFAQNPVKFNPLPFILGFKPAATCIDLQPQTPTKLLIFDRTGKLITLETDPCFIFHHANAYETHTDGNTQIILDSICYSDYPKLEAGIDFLDVNFDQVIPGQFCRFEIDVASGKVNKSILQERSCEFPVIHSAYVGQNYRYCYMGAIAKDSGNAPLQAILKLDVQTGEKQIHSFAPRGFVGEPTFIPHPEGTQEDQGWLVVLVFDAECDRTDIVVLDAENITNSPVATIHLKHHIPFGLHGSFTHETWRS
ncbi:lignostilbene-alpha,beta-dioxygenase-like enzyme [Synechococcus sp. PCC 7502]|uniref:carotenoid oxygenase family protein n=1 Tax=Synechococcus sp. PCC 7502 TaxID=1173263 RepID=UPI00029FF0E6|nr:carotenoid oxygenase family protein [Synechococcus sp. PCC 7502]AFY74249.1 lignostilbene-alpha,beta-dioxygenase-like enzyme [Synechococcus sp. PCC 7502]